MGGYGTPVQDLSIRYGLEDLVARWLMLRIVGGMNCYDKCHCEEAEVDDDTDSEDDTKKENGEGYVMVAPSGAAYPLCG